ncbi:helix-turn-helix domain-containing protein [Sphingobacterium hotanense]|uniref:helix-turn-helix domain-containing protein n=1 Tax=Sphingobacterium hotanense TaxID=649196 RepID=UPI0021A6C39F|nr:helix-turn-helix transcriptional regulator [Sphingobacterium hotanense]
MNSKEVNFRKKLGAKIQEIRVSRNMTQSDLAASIGYKDFQSLARIENGRVTTSIYTIYLIAKGLNCSIDELTSDV